MIQLPSIGLSARLLSGPRANLTVEIPVTIQCLPVIVGVSIKEKEGKEMSTVFLFIPAQKMSISNLLSRGYPDAASADKL